MSLKIEHINQFSGFGQGKRNDEYYFSLGMRMVGKGLEPGWIISQDAKSSTVTGLDLINWFEERLEGGSAWIYAVDDGGDVFKVKDILTTWARQQIPGTASSGNGLITDHSGSQRLLYIQDRYVGSYDGVVWQDTFKGLGWSTTVLKPADLYEDLVVIGNSSSVATLNVTNDTWNFNAFSLPVGFVVRALKSGSNGILIGANFNSRGVLILWDGLASRSIAPWIWTEQEIKAIAKYDAIWVVATEREIFLTNGYSIIKKYELPEVLLSSGENFGPNLPSGMEVEGNKLHLAIGRADYNRNKRGVFILDLVTGLCEFAYTKHSNLFSNSSMGALFISSNNQKYVSHADTFVSPNQEYIGRVQDVSGSSYFISGELGTATDRKKKAEAIILGLKYALRGSETRGNPDWTITVKLYNFERVLWGYAQAKITESVITQITVDGTQGGFNEAQAGDEITVLEGNSAGATRHIVSITGKDTATEVWTLDSALPAVIEINANINVSPFVKIGTKKVNTANIPDERLFFPITKGITGRKFLVKVMFNNPLNLARPHFDKLSFVYEEQDFT